ncbi:outer dense fiber protein 3-like [Pseudomyrmex gracilis]|uniref:outer dense fiber protein 3-like n=1 Tax=Pseudomyrmex gracilis TaxID=219809 RepID=UPI000995D03A|nr:outer dense fiber protein 3-like [Pseudomyrmex gracilis]
MEKKQKVLTCMIKGPGPIYKLPTLVGYTGHDPSRHRNPSYSIRARREVKMYVAGPAPHYNVRNLTKTGRYNPPAYTIREKKHWRLQELGPGPGAYSPELCPPMNHNRRAPVYSIKARKITKYLSESPGPNLYVLPTCIGPKVPDKPARGAFSISGYHVIRDEIKSPGPGAYDSMNYDVIKRRSPAYTLKGKHASLFVMGYQSPAPTFYPLYDTRKRAPTYSFGIKHSECAGVPMTQLDQY